MLATSRALAKDAAELVEVDYEPLPAAVDVWAAAQDGAPLAREGLESNVSYVWKLATDDVDKVFSDADVTVKRRYVQPRLIPNAMETRAVVAQVGAERRHDHVVDDADPAHPQGASRRRRSG